jgi:hypothetical protein
MKKRLLFFMTLFWSVWSFGQSVGDSFFSDNIYYKVTSTSPATVEVGNNGGTGGNPFAGSIANIPSTVTNNSVVYAVTSIGNQAFFFRPALTLVTIPNSVTSIGYRAFGVCPYLSSVTIGNSVTSIGQEAFASTGLTAVTFPNSLTSIGQEAFFSTDLITVTFPNLLTNIGNRAFSDCGNLTSVTIPNSVTNIGESAFNACTSLNAVTIPNSVTNIGESAFSNCANLNSVTVNWANPLPINANVFENTPISNATLKVPAGTKALYQNALGWQNFGSIVEPTHLNFDGINDNVTIPSAVSGAIAQGSEITIEYWFKGTNLQSAVRFQNGNNYIVAGWGGSNPQFIVSTDGGTDGVSNGTESVIENNNWHHIACVWKKNVMFATYLDGVLQNSRVAANVNLPNLAGTEGKLGSLNGGSEFMTGNLDDVRIWNVARTAAQISNNKNCELQGNESGLVAYYKFNQGLDAADNTAITTLTDATAAANNGTLVNFARTGTTSNFLSGSTVITGVSIPSAPSAADQSFCGASNVGALVPTTSATIKWYASATATTALASNATIATGVYYVTESNANGCESERTAVNVIIVENPEPDDTQSFCNSATVNDLQPAPSATITWFADANAAMALLTNTALVDGTTYYVQATGGTCPASPIVASTVSITSATAPTNIGGEVTDNANKNLNVVITGACGLYSGLYVLDGTLNGKNKYLGNYNKRIGYDSGNSRWVLYSNNNIATDAFVLSTTATDVFPPATGWIATDCSSAVPSTMTTATINYNQNICKNSDASNLMPPPSDTIKWFESATGSNDLASNDQVNAGIYYVATVNANGCESPRTLVNIGFLPQPATPIVAGTPTATSGITVTVTGGCSNFSGNYNYQYTDPNGKNVYSSETVSPLIGIYYNIEENRWSLGVYVNNGVYGTDFINTTTSTSAFPPTTGWTSVNNTCAGATLNIGFTSIEQIFCQGATAANIAGTDPSYNSNGQNIALTELLTTGIYAVVSVGANGCESDGTMMQITIETAAPPVPAGATISFASSQIDMTNTCPEPVILLNGTFNYNGQDANGRNKYVFADDAEVKLEFLGFPVNWVIIKQTNLLFTSNDISTANVPPTSGWTSTCGNVAVTLTVNDIAQSFCSNAQVNDLSATGTGTIKWYNVDTAVTALNSNDAIATGDYYVSQTNNNGCESARVKVAVTVTSAPVATAQSFCGSATIADLVATGQNLKWYLEPADLTILASTEALTTRTYYVSQTVGNCTPTRTAVVVTVTSIPSTPTGNATQTLSETSATIAGILVAPSTAVWFASQSDATAGTNALLSTTALTTGTTYYAVTISNGCSSLPLAVTITVTLANDSFDLANFKYYPNPTTEILNIDFSDDIQQVSITNLLGQLVQETKPNTKNAKIDMSGLPAGNYLLQVKTNEQTKTIKVTKN